MSLLSRAGGGIFGSSIGSVGGLQVLNLNMNRMLIEYGHDQKLLHEKITEYMELMQEGHQRKRAWLENNRDLYPTFYAFNHDLNNFFNIFAVTGMHEGLINVGHPLGMKDPLGKKYAHELMQFIHTIIDRFIARDEVACGLEYAPGENAGIKLARHDVKWAQAQGKEIFVQGTGDDIYLTSGCMLPFAEEDMLEQIENNAEFQPYATSGSILHHFLESKVAPEKLAQYIHKLFNKPINYITLTPTITSCMSCHKKIVAKDGAELEKCLFCGSDDLATYSRVIGYVKMIARKKLRHNKGKYEGDYNFWSNARRRDWVERRRMKEGDMID